MKSTISTRTGLDMKTASLIRVFIYSAGSVLLVTAVAKFISSLGDQKVLQALEPLSGLPFREVFIITGLLEVAVGLCCLFHRRMLLQVGLVAWLATCFLWYRLALVWHGYHLPCSCLGNLTGALSISPHTADLVMKVVLGYLLVGSYASLLAMWRPWNRSPGTGFSRPSVVSAHVAGM
jgi:hypothetical protein